MAVISSASGTLSGSSVLESIPATTRKMTLFVDSAQISTTANISVALKESSTAEAGTGIRDNNNGTTMQANHAASTVSIFPSTALSTDIFGFYIIADFIDDSSVRTYVQAWAERDDEECSESTMLMDTAQIEDEFVISTGAGTFTAGNWRAIFEDGSG